MTLRVLCPAKINLFLSVGPPDQTGYHPIRTIFQTIDLADEMSIETSLADSFVCDWPEMPDENTVTKAWRLAREYIDLPTITVTLVKRIPAESGLAGGSSNAAGLLRALVMLTKGKLSKSNALEVAAAVGSDVPFLLVGGTARATGYGELIEPLTDLPLKHVVVAKPDYGVSTVAAYKLLDSQTREWRPFPEDPLELHNDFQSVAPEGSIRLIDELMSLGAGSAQLTGSGSAVFGLFESETTARKAVDQLRSRGVKAWSCRTVAAKEIAWT